MCRSWQALHNAEFIERRHPRDYRGPLQAFVELVIVQLDHIRARQDRTAETKQARLSRDGRSRSRMVAGYASAIGSQTRRHASHHGQK